MRRGERPGSRPRRGLGAGGLLALAGALLVAACAPEAGTPAPAAESSPSRAARSHAPSTTAEARATSVLEVRVMSFNVRWDGFDDGRHAWEHRRDLAVGVLRDESPDSVGLQEPSPRQVTDLSNALPDLESFTFEGTTQPVLYRAGRFRRAQAGGFVLFPGTDLPGSRRTCTWVRLVEIATGRAYYHYNVHLDHRLEESRRASVQRLARQIAARSPADPVVVTGDFNAREDGPALAFLRGENSLDGFASPSPLVDTLRVISPQPREAGTTRDWRGRRGRWKIDYVLAEPAAEVLAARIVASQPVEGRYPSDHLPVVARLRWPAPVP